MKYHTSNNLKWLTFDHLSHCPGLIHGVFLRQGGVSEGPFASLNFGISQGDSPELVEKNRHLALNALKINSYVNVYQYHSDHVVEAQKGECAKADGLITDRLDLALLIMHADCQAAIFYDPIHHIIANAHSGWRGSVANIYRNTIEMMKKRFGSRPEDLLVGISPSLGPSAAQFIHYRIELPESFWAYQVKPDYFDFWEISRSQLIACGVLPHHIEIAGVCTYSNPQECFSYRREKRSGLHGTLVALLKR